MAFLEDDDYPAFQSVTKPPKKKPKTSNSSLPGSSKSRASQDPVIVLAADSQVEEIDSEGEEGEDDHAKEEKGFTGDPKSVRLYYEPGVKNSKSNSYDYKCKWCPVVRKAARTGTWNLLQHQYKCTGIDKARLSAKPNGVRVTKAQVAAYQATLNKKTGALVKAFNVEAWKNTIVQWVATSGLPFTVAENASLRKAFVDSNAECILPSGDTIARRLETFYESACEAISTTLKQQDCTIHYAHDAWTDSQRRKSYLGLIACFVDKKFVYQEVLLRLVPLVGGHGGRRIADSLFPLMQQIGIAERLGPGTADNASANARTAERMAELLFEEHQVDMDAKNLMGCVCHIANLAAQAYLDVESEFRTMSPDAC